MRLMTMAALLALAGCGGEAAPDARGATGASRSVAAPRAAPAFTAANQSWTVRAGPRTPLRCPASSSRAGWPSRVLALGGGKYVKLVGRQPRLASVDAGGHVLTQQELGATRPADARALACGRGGQTAAAWAEYRDADDSWDVRVDGQTIETVGGLSGPPSVAVAFAPDGRVLVAYSAKRAVRAVVLPGGKPFTLGPTSGVADIAAAIGSGGRAVVAWTTIDGGEERNERRRVYAAFGGAGRFGTAQLVDRAKHRNASEFSPSQIRLSVAANGRALLMWATATSSEEDMRRTVRVAEAGPAGHFRTPRQLAADGVVGDVAIRSDGRKLLVWRTDAGLHAGDELVTKAKTPQPRAAFDHGKPHIEWRGGAATRR